MESLAQLEQIIGCTQQSFVEVGRALVVIRKGKLYRERGYKKFATYCVERWDISRSHAYRLIEGAAVVDRLLPMGNILPPGERHTRELARLEPEAQAAAWATALDTAPEGGVTVAHVASVVAAVCAPAAGPEPEPKRPRRERNPEVVAREARICELSLSGLNAEAIAAQLNVTPSYVQHARRKGGLVEVRLSRAPAARLTAELAGIAALINNFLDIHTTHETGAELSAVLTELAAAVKRLSQAKQQPPRHAQKKKKEANDAQENL